MNRRTHTKSCTATVILWVLTISLTLNAEAVAQEEGGLSGVATNVSTSTTGLLDITDATCSGYYSGKDILRQAEVLTSDGHYDAADALIDAALERHPKAPFILLAKAERFIHAEEYARALPWAVRADRSLSDHPDILVALGTIHVGLGELDKAASMARRTGTIVPHWVAGPVLEATILSRRGEAKQALELLLPWLERQPENPTLHEAIANAYDQIGDTRSADNHFEKAREWYRVDE